MDVAEKEVLVSVICTAYNHERYIKKAIESFLMQRTTFRFEVLINDDASTDMTASIIREYENRYPEIIKATYQKVNLYSQGIAPGYVLFQQAKGKYIAVCEGDDFWTDPDKLEKQVSFLEENPDYSLCAHSAFYAKENGDIINGRFFRKFFKSQEISISKMLKTEWCFATNSIVYRKGLRKEYIPPYRGKCRSGDVAFTLYLALQGKVYYFDEFWSAYRVESIGSVTWQQRQEIDKFIKERKEYIAMMHRFDEYTNFLYAEEIKFQTNKILFDISMILDDRAEAKKFPRFFNKLSWKRRLVLFFAQYIPFTKKLLKKYRSFKRYKKYYK